MISTLLGHRQSNRTISVGDHPDNGVDLLVLIPLQWLLDLQQQKRIIRERLAIPGIAGSCSSQEDQAPLTRRIAHTS